MCVCNYWPRGIFAVQAFTRRARTSLTHIHNVLCGLSMLALASGCRVLKYMADVCNLILILSVMLLAIVYFPTSGGLAGAFAASRLCSPFTFLVSAPCPLVGPARPYVSPFASISNMLWAPQQVTQEKSVCKVIRATHASLTYSHVKRVERV
jgi:hypothetical protein